MLVFDDVGGADGLMLPSPGLDCFGFSRRWEMFGRAESCLLYLVFSSHRVFLRAINQFTEVLTKFFMDQASFELQVSVLLT